MAIISRRELSYSATTTITKSSSSRNSRAKKAAENSVTGKHERSSVDAATSVARYGLPRFARGVATRAENRSPDVNGYDMGRTSNTVRSVSGHAGGLSADTLASPSPVSSASTTSASNRQRANNFTAPINETTKAATARPYLPLPSDGRNLTEAEYAAERARIREEFFATYDVMTGVRIAATLGGFFGLMVFLIVWKSRSSSNETLKVLKDPKMAAVAAVCMQEEEEREIQEAIVATGMSIYPDEYDALVYRRQRMLSLGNVSAPPMLNRGYRCASVGGGVVAPGAGHAGYNYLLEPPRRFSYSAMSAGGGSSHGRTRRKSGSESSRIFSNYPMGGSFGTDDYFVETDDELEAEEYIQRDGMLREIDEETQLHKRTDSTRSKQGFLSVPGAGHDSRRSSAMTCCSTNSSYLERRTSAYTLGMSNLPPTLQRKLSTTSRTSSIENWDYYYPDIQVIQPTPKVSPCPSERSINEPSPPPKSKSKSKSKSSIMKSGTTAGLAAPNFVRKHSIVSYDPDSAQAGRKQQIHSISADTVDVYPYNQSLVGAGSIIDLGLPQPKPIQSAPPSSAHQAFHFTDSPTEELRLGVRRKLTLVELQRTPIAQESNNNSFPYTANAATTTAAAAATVTTPAAQVTSSSISVDSTPVSLDKLNGSVSLGSVSVKALFNAEKRAPLASLSSFKISSLEYQDSELRSLDEDSVFGVETAADTDDDMQQLSSDSEEQAVMGASVASIDLSSAAGLPTVDSKPASAALTSRVQHQRQQPLRHAIQKRFSMSAVPSGMGGARPRRPLLQRHRTICASSSDRISLIGQPLQEFQGSGSPALAMSPLETHFGAIVCTGTGTGNSSSATQRRRAQLLQQYSDPQSLPTTTTTTTTTTTEEDTCSTLNTEVGLFDAGGGCVSATHTQYSSLNTVISLGRSSPMLDNNFLSAKANSSVSQQLSQSQQHQPAAQLSLTRLAHDPCASSISDSVITTRPQSICMPASLKELILRGGGGANSLTPSGISKSASNVPCSVTGNDELRTTTTAMTAVLLELPLIKLPTEEEDEDGNHDDNNDVNEALSNRSQDDEESRDPSLPGKERKWSKETLF